MKVSRHSHTVESRLVELDFEVREEDKLVCTGNSVGIDGGDLMLGLRERKPHLLELVSGAKGLSVDYYARALMQLRKDEVGLDTLVQ